MSDDPEDIQNKLRRKLSGSRVDVDALDRMMAQRRTVTFKASMIDDREILSWIRQRSMESTTPGGWEATYLPRWVFCWDFDTSPWADWPWKVVQAKLRKLLKRKLLDGCDCGCRGDWELTEKGLEFLDQSPYP